MKTQNASLPKYLSILKQEFQLRIERNKRFSLRSFASQLEIDAGQLSLVLHGKKGLSRVSALRIGEKLGYQSIQSEEFADLVELHHARSRSRRESVKARVLKSGITIEMNLNSEHKEQIHQRISDFMSLLRSEFAGATDQSADSAVEDCQVSVQII